MLLGNDLCPSVPDFDVAVVTRSQSAAMRKEAEFQTPLESKPEDSSVEAESDTVDKYVEADLASLFESPVAAVLFHLNLWIAQNSFVYSSLA